MSVFRMLAVLLFLCGLVARSAEAREADAYGIRSGDLLSVYVYRQEDMCLRVRVDSEGFIRFPVAGAVKARGRQPEQIGKEMVLSAREEEKNLEKL